MTGTVAWILGAGFSKSLGGPLLEDLLQPDCLRRLDATFPRDEFPRLHGALPEAVVWLFHYGRRFSTGRRPTRVWEALGESLWRDAEEFLDFLDSAASEKGPARATLHALLGHWREDLFGNGASLPDTAEVRGMARRLIAAECSAFLQGADLSSERWGPYQRWARGLIEPGDAIVSFNYDLVPDLLGPGIETLEVLLPDAKVPARGRASVLKLHGSVSWRRTTSGGFQADRPDATTCCRCELDELAIATPGRSKADQARELDGLWTLAQKLIMASQAVVFLGYRFPPSDADARQRILGAIRGNASRYLAIHTVLGPDLQRADSLRLRGLLRHSLGLRQPWSPGLGLGAKTFDHEQQPLFVEDFLSVVDREAIMSPIMRR